mmetsp:Transcript_27890/g.44379  ORF Transcript_27890/g.44379 Transcript_27890/m.44379 type:complete len:1110 (-) Transcript_27890:133-3462(-)
MFLTSSPNSRSSSGGETCRIIKSIVLSQEDTHDQLRRRNLLSLPYLSRAFCLPVLPPVLLLTRGLQFMPLTSQKDLILSVLTRLGHHLSLPPRLQTPSLTPPYHQSLTHLAKLLNSVDSERLAKILEVTSEEENLRVAIIRVLGNPLVCWREAANDVSAEVMKAMGYVAMVKGEVKRSDVIISKNLLDYLLLAVHTTSVASTATQALASIFDLALRSETDIGFTIETLEDELQGLRKLYNTAVINSDLTICKAFCRLFSQLGKRLIEKDLFRSTFGNLLRIEKRGGDAFRSSQSCVPGRTTMEIPPAVEKALSNTTEIKEGKNHISLEGYDEKFAHRRKERCNTAESDIVNILLSCTQHPNIHVVEYTLPFWRFFCMTLSTSPPLPPRKRAYVRRVMLLAIERLLKAMELKPEYILEDEVISEIKDLRQRIGVTFAELANIVGVETVLRELSDMLEDKWNLASNAKIMEWSSVESVLYALRPIAAKVPLDEEFILTRVMSLPLNTSLRKANPIVRTAVLLLIARYSAWIESNIRDLSKLVRVLSDHFVDSCASGVTFAAAIALYQISRNCRKLITTTNLPVFIQAFQLALRPSIPFAGRMKVISGLPYVASVLNDKDAQTIIDDILGNITAELSVSLSRECRDGSHMAMQLLSIFFEVLARINKKGIPAARALEGILKVVAGPISNTVCDSPFMEILVSLCKNGIRAGGIQGACITIPIVLRVVHQVFEAHPRASLLQVAAICFREYCNVLDEKVREEICQIYKSLAIKGAKIPILHPLTATDQYLVDYIDIHFRFIGLVGCNAPIDAVEIAFQIVNGRVKGSVCGEDSQVDSAFLRFLTVCARGKGSPKQLSWKKEIFHRYGSNILLWIIRGVLAGHLPDGNLQFSVEILETLIRYGEDKAKGWIETAVRNSNMGRRYLHEVKLLMTDNANFSKFVSSHRAAFAKLAQEARQTAGLMRIIHLRTLTRELSGFQPKIIFAIINAISPRPPDADVNISSVSCSNFQLRSPSKMATMNSRRSSPALNISVRNDLASPSQTPLPRTPIQSASSTRPTASFLTMRCCSSRSLPGSPHQLSTTNPTSKFDWGAFASNADFHVEPKEDKKRSCGH